MQTLLDTITQPYRKATACTHNARNPQCHIHTRATDRAVPLAGLSSEVVAFLFLFNFIIRGTFFSFKEGFFSLALFFFWFLLILETRMMI